MLATVSQDLKLLPRLAPSTPEHPEAAVGGIRTSAVTSGAGAPHVRIHKALRLLQSLALAICSQRCILLLQLCQAMLLRHTAMGFRHMRLATPWRVV